MTKQTATFYLAAVFGAGLLAGGMGGFSLGMRRAFAPPRPHDMAVHICGDLRTRLRLTPAQVQEIEPVVTETVTAIEAVRTASGKQMADIFAKSNQRIAQFLTPEQRVLMREMDRQRQQFFHKSFHGPPGGPHPPGPPGPADTSGPPPAPPR